MADRPDNADRPESEASIEADHPWHAVDVGEVEHRLATGRRGLTQSEALARFQVHGPNQLEEEPPTSPLIVLVRQFRSPLIFILLLALVVTLFLEEFLDASVIGIVLLLNATIGFAQERKAEGAVRALMQLVVPSARVIRDGRDQETSSRTASRMSHWRSSRQRRTFSGVRRGDREEAFSTDLCGSESSWRGW